MSVNAQFEQLIGNLMVPDNAIRKQSENQYNELKKQPDFLMVSLVQLIRYSQHEHIRKQSTILLRRTLGTSQESLWGSINQESQQTVKNLLMQALDVEQNNSVRQQISEAFSQLAVAISQSGAINDIIEFSFKLSNSENEAHRESGLHILGNLAQKLGDILRNYFNDVKNMLYAGLNDPKSIKVRIAALTATANFLFSLSESHERNQFQSLVPSMLGTISTSLNASKEEDARTAIELFVDMAEHDPVFLKSHLQNIVQAMLTIASHTSLEDSTRQLGVEFLVTLTEQRPGMLRKFPQFVENFLPVLLLMMMDLEDDPEWNQEDEEDAIDITNSDVGEEALDRISLALGGKTIVPVLFSNLLPKLMSHQDWKHKHAALMAISVVGEGCNKYLSPNLSEIVKNILPFLQDAHHRVRWAACNTIGQMSTDFGPEFQKMFHSSVLPGLVAVMDDKANPRVQSHAAAAVINFCEHCPEQLLAPYLDPLLSKLGELIGSGKKSVQEQAVTAIAAVADCAKGHFHKYYDSFMPYLKAILRNAHGKENSILRGKAMECISLIGVAVGKEKFAQDAKEVMDIMIQTQASNLEPDDPQISFLLQSWARICRCLGQDFVPYLPVVMPPLLASAKISPDVTVQDAFETEGEAAPEGWEAFKLGDKEIRIHTSALEEKSTACNMIYCYASELKEGFFNYVEEVANILVPLMRFYYHDNVRSAAISTMPHLLKSAVFYFQKSGAAKGADTTYAKKLFAYMFPTMMESLQEEIDIEILVMGLEALADCIATLGKNGLEQEQMKKITATCLALIRDVGERRGDRYQRKAEEDHDDEEEEKIEDEDVRDDEVLSLIAEVIGHLAKYSGEQFLPLFQEILPVVLELLKPTNKPSDRQVALCIFDDVMEGIGKPALPLLQHFYSSVVEAINDSDAAVRQAAVFGIGVVAEVGRDQIQSQIPDILNRLISVINQQDSRSDTYVNATENAISSVGKITKLGLVDASKILPMWLSWLPVVEDTIESKVTYSMLCDFVESNNPHIQNQESMEKILRVFARVLGTDLIDDSISHRVVNIIRTIPKDLIQRVWTSLPPDQQQKLSNLQHQV